MAFELSTKTNGKKQKNAICFEAKRNYPQLLIHEIAFIGNLNLGNRAVTLNWYNNFSSNLFLVHPMQLLEYLFVDHLS